MSTTISRTAARDAAREADDAELSALRAGGGIATPIEESLYNNDISEEDTEGSDYDGEDDEDAIRGALEAEVDREDRIARIGEVLNQRTRMLNSLYPFAIEGNSITYRGSKTLTYEFCLAACYVRNISEAKYKPLQIAFERLAGLALSILLGRDAHYLRTGYPPESDLGAFGQIVGALGESMPEEWCIDSHTNVRDQRDGGVDVVVWIKPDIRGGSLIFVGNCTCGRNWHHERKHRGRASDSLSRILSRPYSVQMNDFFALPFHIYEKRDWDDACFEGRFVLDRLRLVAIAEKCTPIEWFSLTETLDFLHLISTADMELRPGRSARN